MTEIQGYVEHCPNFKDHGSHLWRRKAQESVSAWMRCPGISEERDMSCLQTYEHASHSWVLGSSSYECPGVRFPERQCIAAKPHLTHVHMFNRERYRCPGLKRVCHCGRPVHVQPDGFTRDLCADCDAVRCDLPEEGSRFPCSPLKGVDDGEGGTVYTVSEILSRLAKDERNQSAVYGTGEALKHAQRGIDTPGCDCGHEGMGRSWHARDCAWRREEAIDGLAQLYREGGVEPGALKRAHVALASQAGKDQRTIQRIKEACAGSMSPFLSEYDEGRDAMAREIMAIIEGSER